MSVSKRNVYQARCGAAPFGGDRHDVSGLAPLVLAHENVIPLSARSMIF